MYVDWKINNENPELLKFKRGEDEDFQFNTSNPKDLPVTESKDDSNSNTGDEFNTSNITVNSPGGKANQPDPSNFNNSGNGGVEFPNMKPEDKKNSSSNHGNNPSSSPEPINPIKNNGNSNRSNNGNSNENSNGNSDRNSDRNDNGNSDGNNNENNNGNSEGNNNKTSSSNSPSNNGNSNINDGNIDNNTFNRNPNDFSTLSNTTYVESKPQSPVNYFTVILVAILIFVFIGFFSAVVFVYYNKKSKRKLHLNNNKPDTLSRMSQVQLNDVYIPNNAIDSINNQVIMNNGIQGYAQPPLNAEEFKTQSIVYVETPQKSNDTYVEQTKFTYHPTKEEIDAYAKIDVNKLKTIENFNGMQ